MNHSYLLTLLFLFFIHSVWGKVWHITVNGNNNNSGDSWTTAKVDIQTAIDEAQEGDQLWIAAGEYFPTRHIDGLENDPRGKAFILRNGISLIGGFEGNETKISDRARVTTSFKTDMETNLKHQTILSGNQEDAAPVWYLKSISPQWRAAFTQFNSYHVVWCDPTSFFTSPTIVEGCFIMGGNANHPSDTRHQQGGGVWMCKGGTLIECTLSHNSAYDYGAFVNYGALSNCYITDNYATQTGGGGYNSYDGTIEHGAISFNSAQYDAGGVQNFGSIAGSIIAGNYANMDGGGVYNFGKLSNCLLFGNYANALGGAVYNFGSIANSTIAHNITPEGQGGVVNHTDGVIVNSLLWRSEPIGNGAYGYSATTDTYLPGEGNISISSAQSHFVLPTISYGIQENIQNRMLWNNSDWRITANSPCIDAGTSTTWNNQTIPTIDINGVSRHLFGTNYDIGAYEYDNHLLDIKKEISGVKVFPNPFDTELFIDHGQPSCSIRLYNNIGQIIFQQSSDNIITRIETSAFSGGSYIIEIIASEEKTVKKLIKH